MLTEFALDWKLAGHSTGTLKSYLSILRHAEADYGLPLNLAQAKAIISAKRDSGASPSSVNFVARALKAYHRWWAQAMEEADPLAKLAYPKVPKPAPGKVAPDAEIVKLLAASKGSSFLAVRDRTMVIVLRDTGMRRGELASMLVDDLDFEAGTILLRGTKNGSDRLVPMSMEVRKALRLYLHKRSRHLWADDPHVFIGAKGPLRSNGVGMALSRLADRAGVNLSAHMFRRGMAHRWAMAGGSDDALMAVCGWKSTAMPSRYRAELVAQLARTQFERIVG